MHTPAASSRMVTFNDGPPPALQSPRRSWASAGRRHFAAAKRRVRPISAVGGALWWRLWTERWGWTVAQCARKGRGTPAKGKIRARRVGARRAKSSVRRREGGRGGGREVGTEGGRWETCRRYRGACLTPFPPSFPRSPPSLLSLLIPFSFLPLAPRDSSFPPLIRSLPRPRRRCRPPFFTFGRKIRHQDLSEGVHLVAMREGDGGMEQGS
jgi:hypothetical protein